MFIFSVNDFRWNAEERYFSAEVSELPSGEYSPIQQIGFSGKRGLKLKGKTGKIVTYEVYKTDYDSTHEDIYGYHLRPTMESISSVPECLGTEVFIIND